MVAVTLGRVVHAFQTLIGTVKSGNTSCDTPRWRKVSNPHRYGQKEADLIAIKGIGPFQTLIGTVKSPSLALPA